MLPEEIKVSVLEMLASLHAEPVNIEGVSPAGGGCINTAFRLDSAAGVYFMKYNDAGRYPGMFESEARGLRLLQGHVGVASRAPADGSMAISVPSVIGCGAAGRYSLLVLEYLESGSMRGDFWEVFGRGLAALHRHTNGYFGLDHPNYIGSLPQSNDAHGGWTDFFIVQRLEPQLRLARDSGRADRELVQGFQDLYRHLSDLFPEEPPALLHGDLWSGNYMVGADGGPAIIDPAVYYGHRYMDIGMSKLFGGFSHSFYEAYNQAYAMENNWREAIEVANLYPLMVHVNLFGGGYPGSVKAILKRYRR